MPLYTFLPWLLGAEDKGHGWPCMGQANGVCVFYFPFSAADRGRRGRGVYTREHEMIWHGKGKDVFHRKEVVMFVHRDVEKGLTSARATGISLSLRNIHTYKADGLLMEAQFSFYGYQNKNSTKNLEKQNKMESKWHLKSLLLLSPPVFVAMMVLSDSYAS